MSVGRDIHASEDWRLRAADLSDTDGLYILCTIPLVYRYLFDGAPPEKEFIRGRVVESVASAGDSCLGMWFLENAFTRYAGCVELRPYPDARSAEVLYSLDPRFWGQGLATRMAWAVITHAFFSSEVDFVIAGADGANVASFAVMRRLGMRFHKDVLYPLGAGAEYVLHRDDQGPTPRPPLIGIVKGQ
jgi:[ribosomal protein S5]-alanine N-acetyltransferase